MLILENIGLAELQKGAGDRWGQERGKKENNASFYVSKIFVHICHRKTTPTNGSNALVIKESWKVWGFFPPINKHHCFLAKDPAYNLDVCISSIWVKKTSCFTGARKNVKRPQVPPSFFLPDIENASHECFPFSSMFCWFIIQPTLFQPGKKWV